MKTTLTLVGLLALGTLTGCGTADASPSPIMEGTVTDLSFRGGSLGCTFALRAPSVPKPPVPAKPAPPKPVVPVAPKPVSTGYGASKAASSARATAGYNGVGVPVQKPAARHTVKVYHPIIVGPYGYRPGYTCYRNDCWRVVFRMANGSLGADCVPWSEYVQYDVGDHYPRYEDD